MQAKRNRYDLSLWDVRKLSLYGRALEASKLQLFLNLILQFRPDRQDLRLLHGDGLDNSTSTKTE
jgi:hypothetical protein